MNFEGKTAVVTGGASGIGRALVERCLKEGMNVVLADVEDAAMAQTLDALQPYQDRLLCRKTDVADADQMAELARETQARFGGVHLLFNNAGVGAGSTVWDATLADWRWVMGVNLWGVIHGCHSFIPLMIETGEPGYVVNTASIAGLVRGHHSATYSVTKHAVVALTEQLTLDFERTGVPLKAAVLCPSWVNTRINEGGRNRPDHLRNSDAPAEMTPETRKRWEEMQAVVARSTPPEEIAEFVFAGIQAGRFYLVPHAETRVGVERRFNAIMQDYDMAP